MKYQQFEILINTLLQKREDLINEDKKKWQQIKNAMENGVETLFPHE